MKIRNPKHRLKKFADTCKTKKICPSTGTPQPQYRLDGMKITAEFKVSADEEDSGMMSYGGERKIQVTAEMALKI